MAPPKSHLLIFTILTLSLFISPFTCSSNSNHDRNSFISMFISTKGLDFIKDLLITQAISSLTPLKIPKISKSFKIPVLGNVYMALSNITIHKIEVLGSYVKLGDTGVSIVASGTTCDLGMNWHYSYNTWLVPIGISDKGTASIKVESMEVGITLGMENQGGTLKLTLMDCGCYVQDISIELDGGASWLYQGMIDAFEGQIRSAVENAITQKLKEGIVKLDSLLQSLPKGIEVDDIASLNVTFVNQPVLTSSSIEFEIKGLFAAKEEFELGNHVNENFQSLVSCTDQAKMLGISLDEAVFNSASALYYDSEYMQWIVDKVPDQTLLTTSGWRFIIPQLYKKYPNHDMDMNVTLSSPPIIRIAQNNIEGTIYADLIIDVLEAEEVIPVACISLVIRASGFLKMSGNNLTSSLKLNDFTMSLKWSQIGNLRMFLIQPVVWTLIETVALPFANSRLGKGFPLPMFRGFTLENAEIISSDARITVCSDVSYAESYFGFRPLVFVKPL